MLKLVDIIKEYKIDDESTLALHGIDLEFRKNEFVSILGPSGCGKTTLLNIIGGLDRYTSGDIQVGGVSTKEFDDVDWDTYRNKRIGFVFQSYNLIPHMNILNNVAMALTLAGVGREERKQRAMDALRKVGLETQARKRPNQLSGGQMQRVAIARALVNNPEVILADEPTGALDSESGIQVMDLLKEVAEDRLVIMVTHNPLLAEQYSTRIVYLKDGELVGDTMPYDSKKDEPAAEPVKEEPAETVPPAKCCAKKKTSRLARYLKKAKEQDKSSMSPKTAFTLSWNNLLSKKGRTFLTSIAGSIGIIGILIVLSLSAGTSGYVATLEQNALSQYPITIGRTGADMAAIMEIMMNNQTGRPSFPGGDTVHTNPILSEALGSLLSLTAENDLKNLKTYLDDNFNVEQGYLKYDYGTSFNVYAKAGKNTRYSKSYPFTDAMDEIMGPFGSLLDMLPIDIDSLTSSLDAWDQISTNYDLLNQQYDVLEGNWPQNWDEVVIVVDEKNQVKDFDLFTLGLEKPDLINVLLMLDIGGNPEIVELIKNMGLVPPEILDIFLGMLEDDKYKNYTVSFEDLMNIDFRVLADSDYLTVSDKPALNDGRETYETRSKGNSSTRFIEENGIKLKVAGIVRPRPDAVVTSINCTVGYRPELIDEMIKRSYESTGDKSGNVSAEAIVEQQWNAFNAAIERWDEGKNPVDFYSALNDITIEGIVNSNSDVNDDETSKDEPQLIFSLGVIDENDKDRQSKIDSYLKQAQNNFEKYLRAFGWADTGYPQSISIYSMSFDAKDEIKAIIGRFEQEHNTTIKYTDMLDMMMGYVGTMTDTVTGTLVGFSAISLLVSTIMIAIIIYTSVLERRKEIGVLRSLGARKKDISRVFISESAILGAYSGLIGIIVSVILAVIADVVIASLLGISGLLTITWWHCVMMFVISIVLSILAGFIPSRIAAKKDPAIALRSE